MPSFTLCDTSSDLWIDSFAIDAAGLGQDQPEGARWSVSKRTLRGGRRDGVDLIVLNNGALELAIVPTRGMSIWKGRYKADHLGWTSPVADGPVHPRHVNLAAGGGIGWLDGFDELLVRCGLESNGAPFETKSVLPDGSERHAVTGVHGHIGNLPAHKVVIHVEEKAPYTITVEGHVDEAHIFGPSLRLITKIQTTPGSDKVVVRDEILNRKDQPGEFQLLYHWNFGPPYLGEGSVFSAPIQLRTPRDRRAAEDVATYETYRAPEPGFAEQVHYMELLGEGPEGRTVTMLRDRAGNKAVALRFATKELPCFALWKCTGGLADGYVTGLEPATNYPNARPFEKAKGRVVTLAPGASHVAETTLEIHDTPAGVAALQKEIAALQAQSRQTVHQAPTEPYAPEW